MIVALPDHNSDIDTHTDESACTSDFQGWLTRRPASNLPAEDIIGPVEEPSIISIDWAIDVASYTARQPEKLGRRDLIDTRSGVQEPALRVFFF